ncbi:S8 family serine peptidase [Sphaerisporangium perillae]|uniref:S8 family serine peptidase n=1 Tax=Sphaerisporangium perillae TaxID=2935860 RepID=UPI00200E4DCF|nr:S8 family serine peptidase [Sphaerisporangium perillae]
MPERQPDQTEGSEEQREAPGGHGLTWRDLVFPQELLDRHGARVLDPSTAPLDEGERRPDSTVYRADVLLIPAQVLGRDGMYEEDDDEQERREKLGRHGLAWIDEQLQTIGLKVALREPPGGGNDERPRWHAVALEIAPGAKDVVVDAWRALRVLRRALAEIPDTSPKKPYLAKIALDHLLVGSAFAGVGGAGIGGEPATSGHGVPDPGSAAAPVNGYARTPVTVVAGPPARRPEAEIGGRRPVLVIPDTGVPPQGHPWFRPVTAPDSFLSVSEDAQKVIQGAVSAGGQAGAAGAGPLRPLAGYEEVIAPPNPLLGIMDSHTGHGLMQAGLVCQIAPDARVLMLKVMYADGVVPESALHEALNHIIATIEHGSFVDVMTFACGGFHETAEDKLYTPILMERITRLRELGVVVVAAAGNHASSRPFWPAAGAVKGTREPGLAPMLAVAATNPDDTIAIFSNEHEAVEWLAPGAAVVSTFPAGVRGSATAGLRTRDLRARGHRASFDKDNHGDFATWSGSSFAVPILGAAILALMIEDSQALDLKVTDAQTARARAHRVVGKLMAGTMPAITPV